MLWAPNMTCKDMKGTGLYIWDLVTYALLLTHIAVSLAGYVCVFVTKPGYEEIPAEGDKKGDDVVVVEEGGKVDKEV